jgi:hypothetical protein
MPSRSSLLKFTNKLCANKIKKEQIQISQIEVDYLQIGHLTHGIQIHVKSKLKNYEKDILLKSFPKLLVLLEA